MSDARTGNKCTMYQAGHQVHWIQVIGSSLPRNPRHGRIVSIRRGVITVDVDGQERTYTNHATRDLRAFVEKLGSFVVVDEPRSLLKVPLADGSLKCFSIADASKPLHRCRFDQLAKFDLEALVKRTSTHGGFDVPSQLLREHQGGRPSSGCVPLEETQRRHLTEDTFRELLESGKERAYVVFSNLDQPHEHVRFLFEYGLFAADVCSREWGTVPRPLPDEAAERLAKLGFVRSTRFGLNFGKSGLSPDARALAELLETLFREAYETPSRFPLGTRIELHPTPDAPGANPDRLGWTDAVP